MFHSFLNWNLKNKLRCLTCPIAEKQCTLITVAVPERSDALLSSYRCTKSTLTWHLKVCCCWLEESQSDVRVFVCVFEMCAHGINGTQFVSSYLCLLLPRSLNWNTLTGFARWKGYCLQWVTQTSLLPYIQSFDIPFGATLDMVGSSIVLLLLHDLILCNAASLCFQDVSREELAVLRFISSAARTLTTVSPLVYC